MLAIWQPQKKWDVWHTDQLFSSSEEAESWMFHPLTLWAEGRIYWSKLPSPLSSRWLDCAGTDIAPRLERQNPVLWGHPSEKLGCWMHKLTLFTPGKIWELVGFSLIIWFCARGRDSGMSQISPPASLSLVSHSPRSRKLLIHFWGSHKENLSMSCCWIFLFVGVKKTPGFPALHLADVNSIGFSITKHSSFW